MKHAFNTRAVMITLHKNIFESEDRIFLVAAFLLFTFFFKVSLFVYAFLLR